MKVTPRLLKTSAIVWLICLAVGLIVYLAVQIAGAQDPAATTTRLTESLSPFRLRNYGILFLGLLPAIVLHLASIFMEHLRTAREANTGSERKRPS